MDVRKVLHDTLDRWIFNIINVNTFTPQGVFITHDPVITFLVFQFSPAKVFDVIPLRFIGDSTAGRDYGLPDFDTLAAMPSCKD